MSYMGNCEEYLQTAKSNADDLIEVIFLILFHSLTLAILIQYRFNMTIMYQNLI